MFAVAVRTYEGLPNSVQAKCTSSPRRAIRGKPLEREISVLAITAGSSSEPLGCTRLTLICPPSAFPDSQQTRADPSGNIKASTRPRVSPSSTSTALPKVAPASLENAALTRGESLAPVYQAITTFRPSAATDGPLTGHPLISQLSECTGRGPVQLFCRWFTK